MKDYLFRTRTQQDFPDEVMIEHLRQALRKEIAGEGTSVSGLHPGRPNHSSGTAVADCQ
jgi:hypothetical protein